MGAEKLGKVNRLRRGFIFIVYSTYYIDMKSWFSVFELAFQHNWTLYIIIKTTTTHTIATSPPPPPPPPLCVLL